MKLLLLIITIVLQFHHTSSRATPYVGKIDPPFGSDEGGYTITLSGRNLGFLDIDCAVNVGILKATNVKVTDSWDKLEATVPGCPMCGKVDISVTCGGGGSESNTVPFTMTNECYGPTKAPARPELPSRFSSRENCTVCQDLVHLTMSAVADKTSYQGLQSAMQQACYTTHFKKWLVPATKCELDLSPACRLLLATTGDILVDTMWNLWNDGYWNGELPNMVCTSLKKCLPGAMFEL
jgi:hypothetical protein|tara:strand:- start:270 stop:980 length:711 start_codon:yes stop_codon:yes gene_type:complete